MIVYMILDNERQPVRTNKGITYRVYNSPRDAYIARASLSDYVLDDRKRKELKEKYPIVMIDTDRLDTSNSL